MGDVIYTTVAGKIKPLLDKIKTVGVPPKVTNAWLKTIGFTSSNDGSLIGVLKVAQLIDGSQVPTPLWQKFRGSEGPTALAEGIRTGYAELYGVYPDAHERPNVDLENVFSQSSKAGKQAITKAVATFKNLAKEADFSKNNSEVPAEAQHFETSTLHAPVEMKAPLKPRSSAPNLHIDVQVHISADASLDQIDQIFASMAKHLYGA
ncbi:hypothetical protein SAMN03159338_3366 [Sphingomonas sp. NFR04]|uniref:DUF5343 domain-containing protein n=1 Tax=Sphingomonas sp. NFR04 TaxID=1566283 RepID=UPI0008F17BE3|nr:DUF5343 domain-containing protein [Sphingomonas sp. NFR04]SFK14006.1 hypothetical protein SAMN03159338_3366 [Sphingomonas sp. NFR04]